MTDQTVQEEILIKASEEPYHTILEIWRGVLAPAKDEKDSRITPQWANRIVSSYQQVRFSDMEVFRQHYFSHVIDLAEILQQEIDGEPECLAMTSPEEDAETNAFHYLNVLFLWQEQFLMWELEWDCLSKHAAVEIAALSEVHRMFFGESGILGLLDQIKFEFTDEHKQMLATSLEDMRKEFEENRGKE